MTVDVPLPALAGEQMEARIERALRYYHRNQEAIVCSDFAASVASTLLEMRPLAESGDKAAGISEGLEMAARTILRLAGAPTDQETPSDH